MKTRLETTAYDLLLLTKPVELSESFLRYLNCYLTGKDVPAVVVAREGHAFRDHYLIIDGNQRAVAAALAQKPVRYFLLTDDTDVDAFLKIEARGGLGSFPARDFLTGGLSFRELIWRVIWMAGHEMYFHSVRHAADHLLQLHPTLLEPPIQSEPVRDAPGIAVPEFSETPTARWIRRLGEHFLQHDTRRVFVCPYPEFARICGEAAEEGEEIAKTLQDLGVLELVEVVEMKTGSIKDGEGPLRTLRWRLHMMH